MLLLLTPAGKAISAFDSFPNVPPRVTSAAAGVEPRGVFVGHAVVQFPFAGSAFTRALSRAPSDGLLHGRRRRRTRRGRLLPRDQTGEQEGDVSAKRATKGPVFPEVHAVGAETARSLNLSLAAPKRVVRGFCMRFVCAHARADVCGPLLLPFAFLCSRSWFSHSLFPSLYSRTRLFAHAYFIFIFSLFPSPSGRASSFLSNNFLGRGKFPAAPGGFLLCIVLWKSESRISNSGGAHFWLGMNVDRERRLPELIYGNADRFSLPVGRLAMPSL